MNIEEKKKRDKLYSKLYRQKHKEQIKLAAWLKFKKQWENEQTKQTETT